MEYREHLKNLLVDIVVGDYWVLSNNDYDYHMNTIGRRAVRFPALYRTESWKKIQELRQAKEKPTEWLDERMVELLEKLQADFQL
jgi:hypothetical protein